MDNPAAQRRAGVAIVTRTKQRPILLARALDDVLNQTFTDWRLVVVNDGGEPDDVMSLIEARAERFAGRVEVIHNESSRGLQIALNQGVTAIDSEFVAIHDDDDTWDPEFLALTVDYLRTTAKDDQGVMVPIEIVRERIVGDRVVEDSRELFLPEMRQVTLMEMMKANRAVPISFVYRREMLDEIGVYNEELSAVEDWEFNLRFLMAHGIGFLPGRPLAFWHHRPKALGTTSNSIFAADDVHNYFDIKVREEHFQAWVEQNGIGLPLFFHKMLDREAGALHHRITELNERLDRQAEQLARIENQLADNSLLATVKRKYRKHILREP